MTKDLPPLSLVVVPTSSTPVLNRQRKAEMTAAAAAAMVAAAKVAKTTNVPKLSSDPALLGRDLIRRVDHATIGTIVDKLLLERELAAAESASPLYKSNDDMSSLEEKNQETPESLFLPSPQHNHTTRTFASPSPINNTLSERHALRRDAAVNELLTTERSYCRDLDTLVNHFFKGIVDAKCVSDEEKQRLVRNGFDILKFQTRFAVALLKASKASLVMMSSTTRDAHFVDDIIVSIAKCFCEWGNQFEVYIGYCIYHDKAASLYKELMETNHAFAAVIDKLHLLIHTSDDSGNGRRMFDDYLIMPVQRLFKYKLLLESILKTTQSDSPEHISLSQALKVMHEVAVRLNTKKSNMEAERKTRLFMSRLDSGWANAISKRFYSLLGSCLLIGTLDVRVVHGDAKLKRLGCALFSSYMIIVKAKRHDKYEPRHWFPLRIFDFDVPDDHSIFSHSWILRSEAQSFEFTAMSEQEKQIWVDTLQHAIRVSRESISPIDSIQQKAPGSAVEELFVSSFSMSSSSNNNHAQPLESPSSASVYSYMSPTEHFFSFPHAPVPASTSGSGSLDTPQTDFSTDTPDNDSPVHVSAHSSSSNTNLNSPGLRSQASFSDFCDFLSNTVADIRIQRQYQQYSLRCINVDNKFEDVCTTPILTARSQVRADRNSGVDQWKRRTRMGKSASMLAFSSIIDYERLQQQYILASPRNKPFMSSSEAFKNAVRRKASLPSRLRMSDSFMFDDQQYQPHQQPQPRPASKMALHDEYQQQQQSWRQLPPQPPPPISTESMIFKLSRQGSVQSNHQQPEDDKARLPPTPPRSLSEATMGFARTSSRFLGRMVEKLGTIGTPRRARRCTNTDSSSFVSHTAVQSADGEIIAKTGQKRTKKQPVKKPPPLVIPGAQVIRVPVPRQQQQRQPRKNIA